MLLTVLQVSSELVWPLRNLIPGARWRGLARLGDRETRIRVAWHMGAERGLWDSASWDKGLLLTSTLIGQGGLWYLESGGSGTWLLTVPGRERDVV